MRKTLLFTLALSGWATMAFTQDTRVRYAFPTTGYEAQRLFIQEDGSYLLGGELEPSFLDHPFLAAFEPDGSLRWSRTFPPFEIWEDGPSHVFPASGDTLLVFGNYGFECDVFSGRGLKAALISSTTGALLESSYYLPVHELPGMSDAIVDLRALADYAPQEDLLLIGINNRFLTAHPRTEPEKLELLPVDLGDREYTYLSLVTPDRYVMAADSQLLFGNLTAFGPDLFYDFPDRIRDVRRNGSTFYILAADTLWRYSPATEALPLTHVGDATRLELIDGERIVLYDELTSFRIFDLATQTLAAAQALPGAPRDFRIRGDRYYLAANHSVGGFLPGLHAYVQQGPLSDIRIDPGWDIRIETVATDSITFLEKRQAYYHPTDEYREQWVFRADLSFSVRNQGSDTLRALTLRWEPEQFPILCGLISESVRYEGLSVPPGQVVTLTAQRQFMDIYQESGQYTAEFGFYIDIPNQDIDLQTADNYGNFVITRTRDISAASPRVKVFPNPARVEWQLATGGAAFAEYRLYDSGGRLVRRSVISAAEAGADLTISAARLPAGIYWVRLIDHDGRSVTLRVVKSGTD